MKARKAVKTAQTSDPWNVIFRVNCFCKQILYVCLLLLGMKIPQTKNNCLLNNLLAYLSCSHSSRRSLMSWVLFLPWDIMPFQSFGPRSRNEKNWWGTYSVSFRGIDWILVITVSYKVYTFCIRKNFKNRLRKVCKCFGNTSK